MPGLKHTGVDTPHCHPTSASPEGNFIGVGRILPVVAVALGLSACVGSKVNETLDVAALNAPDAELTSENAISDEAVASEIAALTTLPVPVPSPGFAGETGNVTTALVDETTNNAALQAAESATNTESETATALADSQPADLETAALAATDPSSQPKPALKPQSQPVKSNVAAVKPKQTGGLFSLLFGNKKKKPTQTAALKQAPKSKTTVTAPPTQEELNSALPGVKRNSVIFGIEDEDGRKNVQIASLGGLGRTLSPSGLILQTERVKVDCFKPELLRILAIVERKYGKKVMVTSGYRSPKRNRRAGGARNSTHIYCKAADIQVEGVSKWDLAKFLRTVPGRGGVGTYCRTKSVHIDVGSVRDWHHPCRRSSRKKRKA